MPHNDYAANGFYFVTVVTHGRLPCLGTVADDSVDLTTAGAIVEGVWRNVAEQFQFVSLDALVVMPNHVHAVLVIERPAGGVMNHAATRGSDARVLDVAAQFIAPAASPTLGKVVRALKASSTRFIRQNGLEDFGWQPNYYEHVIRTEEDLTRIRDYIDSNPTQWALDPDNPAR